MSEPGHVLEEAARLLDTLRRQLAGESTARDRADDDVWGRATSEQPVHHIATGAPECEYCPVCRAIAAARRAREGQGGAVQRDLAARAADIGQSLVDLVRSSLAVLDQDPPTGKPEPTPTGFSTPRPSQSPESPASAGTGAAETGTAEDGPAPSPDGDITDAG